MDKSDFDPDDLATCESCVYGEVMPYGEIHEDVICNRYPKVAVKSNEDWCGEHPAFPEVVRALRLHPIRWEGEDEKPPLDKELPTGLAWSSLDALPDPLDEEPADARG